MDFENRTQSPAALLRSAGSGATMYASLITRVRRRLTDEGALVAPPAALALTDLRRDLIETPYGTFEPDLFFPRTGTDVIVLGKAVSARPVAEMTVRVDAGPYHVELLVTGERSWQRDDRGELAPGAAAPFTEMPITYRNAFGGVARTEYGDCPEPNNPAGKGFYLTRDEAVGRPLPNIEDPASPIRRWNDRPSPVGLGPYPLAWGLRLLRVVSVDPDTAEPRIHVGEGLYDRAHPLLSGRRLLAGQTIAIEGMSLRGRVVMAVPPCPFEVSVALGQSESRLALTLEEVLVDLDALLVDFTYRKLFKYEMVRGEQRKTALLMRPEGRQSP
ncbi:DUF2169 domain-containing protein [Sorangium sp. So ce131]|uniref:DUF2169 domain-containing protein n=1 Tax=Sorangium sp. So ce131 TaxID=3133282 RepID=UPI003F5D7444